ncbi:MAG: sulfur oxidation c-type cytochrome SoxX [Sulfuricella sp.]|nr:sulfur oxidation c-type cytochrome SoxX [Sulfuricella sp.]
MIETAEKEIVMMKKPALLFVLVAGLGAASLAMAAEGGKEPAGRVLAFDKAKGNCLACHAIPNDPKAVSPGTIGPPFIMMKERFPDRAKLRAQIWDATMANPRTAMPPFGKHQILTEQEIDQVVDYVLSL